MLTTIIQFIKFGIVGAINTVLSYGINNGCYYLFGLHEQISNFIAFVITVFISYVLNSKYVFDDEEPQEGGETQAPHTRWAKVSPCPRSVPASEVCPPALPPSPRPRSVPTYEACPPAIAPSPRPEKSGFSWKALGKVYASYALTELVIMGILLFVEERIFGMQHFIATFLNLAVTVPLNFLLNKFWAYRNNA